VLPAKLSNWNRQIRHYLFRWWRAALLLLIILTAPVIAMIKGINIWTITSIFNAFIHGEIDPVPVHVVLIGGAILAEIAIARGIVLESKPPEERTKREKWGIRFVLCGVVFSALFTIFLFVFDEGISNRQTGEIIALLRNSLPRTFEMSAFSKKLIGAAPATVEIRYVVACTDCQSLSFWLFQALKNAGWSPIPPIPIDPRDRNWVKAVLSLHAESSGITVVLDSPDKISADPKSSDGALMGALVSALGFGFSGYAVNIMGGVDVNMPRNLIRVVIAPKA
jgi:hypothetical protein